MGDNFLKKQAKNFRKRRDLALGDIKHSSLFQRPDVVNRIFHAKPCTNEKLAIGEELWAAPDPEHQRISVIRAHRKVAFIDGDGVAALMEAFSADNTPGLIPLRVIAVLKLSEVAQLQISEELKND